MDHPREHAFKRLTRPRRFTQWLITFERSWTIRNDHQRWSGATEPSDLQVSAVLSDVRIGKGTILVSFFQVAAGKNVVEDHRNTERAELNWLSSLVPELKTQDEPATGAY